MNDPLMNYGPSWLSTKFAALVGVPAFICVVLLYMLHHLLFVQQEVQAQKIETIQSKVSSIENQNAKIMEQHIELRSAQERQTDATIAMCRVFARAFKVDEGYCDSTQT